MTENRGSRRKLGRQPEDTRASGYYSRLFREGEIMDMKAREIDGLMDEIALLRVWTRTQSQQPPYQERRARCGQARRRNSQGHAQTSPAGLA